MNTDNLISLARFAEQSGLRLITPQKIEPVEIGGRKFIDITIYPPKAYKK